jgi:hypothetical protein
MPASDAKQNINSTWIFILQAFKTRQMKRQNKAKIALNLLCEIPPSFVSNLKIKSFIPIF